MNSGGVGIQGAKSGKISGTAEPCRLVVSDWNRREWSHRDPNQPTLEDIGDRPLTLDPDQSPLISTSS